MTATAMTSTEIYLVRYGAVPEVARFLNTSPELPTRGTSVVIETDRGLQLGLVLEQLKPAFDTAKDSETEFRLVRTATLRDREVARELTRECEDEFAAWCARISQWELTDRSGMDTRSPETDFVRPLRPRPRHNKTRPPSRRSRLRRHRSAASRINRPGHNPQIFLRHRGRRRMWMQSLTEFSVPFNEFSPPRDFRSRT